MKRNVWTLTLKTKNKNQNEMRRDVVLIHNAILSVVFIRAEQHFMAAQSAFRPSIIIAIRQPIAHAVQTAQAHL